VPAPLPVKVEAEPATLHPSTTLRAKIVTYVLGTICYLCVRSGHSEGMELAEGVEPPTL
jgi:hypothetical protein